MRDSIYSSSQTAWDRRGVCVCRNFSCGSRPENLLIFLQIDHGHRRHDTSRLILPPFQIAFLSGFEPQPSVVQVDQFHRFAYVGENMPWPTDSQQVCRASTRNTGRPWSPCRKHVTAFPLGAASMLRIMAARAHSFTASPKTLSTVSTLPFMCAQPWVTRASAR